MHDISVRRVDFEFPAELDDVLPGVDPVRETYMVAFSLMMPALEPYLIRTMRAVTPRITDEALAEDVRRFSGQEAQHFKNHRRINDIIIEQVGPAVGAQLQQILDDLEKDYRRCTAEKSDRANLVFAEGFEAMTCAMATAMMVQAAAGDSPVGRSGTFGPWQQLWAWHAAEEIEHRTVAFGVYEHLVGSYWYRVLGSIRAQWRFQQYIHRLQTVLLTARGRPAKRHRPPWLRGPGRTLYLRTFRPGYDPGAIEPPDLVGVILSMYPS
ncbi:MAG: metal-dependent hydrolase [Ilumatobacteraceae bacterium]